MMNYCLQLDEGNLSNIASIRDKDPLAFAYILSCLIKRDNQLHLNFPKQNVLQNPKLQALFRLFQQGVSANYKEVWLNPYQTPKNCLSRQPSFDSFAYLFNESKLISNPPYPYLHGSDGDEEVFFDKLLVGNLKGDGAPYRSYIIKDTPNAFELMAKYLVPCPDLIISDRYLFEKQNWKSGFIKNIGKLIKAIKNTFDGPINLVIGALGERMPKFDEVYNFLTDLLPDGSKVTLIPYELDPFKGNPNVLHKRFILSHYGMVVAENGFQFFQDVVRNGKTVTLANPNDFTIYSLVSNENRKTANNELNRLQEYVNQNYRLVSGDKVSNFIRLD